LQYETTIRQGILPHFRTKWLGAKTHQRQPHIYAKSSSVARLSVPVHGNTALKLGLLKSLMKLAELLESDF
jgi:hypothetical protein